jgi:hypothetical protein
MLLHVSARDPGNLLTTARNLGWNQRRGGGLVLVEIDYGSQKIRYAGEEQGTCTLGELYEYTSYIWS